MKKRKFKTIEEISLEARVGGEFMFDISYRASDATCKTEFYKNSLALDETEPIIPEWFFESTISIDSERIKFMNNEFETT